MTESTVSLADLADAVSSGGQIGALTNNLTAAGIEVVADWKGAPAVAEPDARRWVAQYHERRAQNEVDQRAYRAYKQKRETDRLEAARTASRKAREAYGKKKGNALVAYAAEGFASITSTTPLHHDRSPAAASAGHAAFKDAYEKYDRKHPEMTITEWKKKNR